jgi:hypothetical protein
MARLNEAIPVLSDAVIPSVVLGTADLTYFAYQGNGYADLLARIEKSGSSPIARRFDTAIALQLGFRRADGLDLLDKVLSQSVLFRVGQARPGALRLLALVCPGDLMTNTPLDFLTNHLHVQLDLLFIRPGQPLPAVIPDHDVAFFAASEADPDTLARLSALYAAWPRPSLNNPAGLPDLERDALSRLLAGAPGIVSPTAVALTRADLQDHLSHATPIRGFSTAAGIYPCLIRPYGSHAGTGLGRATTPSELQDYLRQCLLQDFFLTAYQDYSSADGLFRKFRVAFIDRQPFLCHMAVSSHWMVHYLNAGMEESADKRAEEAYAMTTFDTGFATRHGAAFAALHDRLGFDYYSIDCAETQDGRLLVFEADTAAIIHDMDPVDLFPYKRPQMQRVFSAFGAMLRRRAGSRLAKQLQPV